MEKSKLERMMNSNSTAYTNLSFKRDSNINIIVDSAQSNIDVAPVIFWVLWMILTAGLVVLFYYAENKWLY